MIIMLCGKPSQEQCSNSCPFLHLCIALKIRLIKAHLLIMKEKCRIISYPIIFLYIHPFLLMGHSFHHYQISCCYNKILTAIHFNPFLIMRIGMGMGSVDYHISRSESRYWAWLRWPILYADHFSLNSYLFHNLEKFDLFKFSQKNPFDAICPQLKIDLNDDVATGFNDRLSQSHSRLSVIWMLSSE